MTIEILTGILCVHLLIGFVFGYLIFKHFDKRYEYEKFIRDFLRFILLVLCMYAGVLTMFTYIFIKFNVCKFFKKIKSRWFCNHDWKSADKEGFYFYEICEKCGAEKGIKNFRYI